MTLNHQLVKEKKLKLNFPSDLFISGSYHKSISEKSFDNISPIDGKIINQISFAQQPDIDKGIVGSVLLDEEEEELPVRADAYLEGQLIAAEDAGMKKKVAKLIFVIGKVIINRKKAINYNYDSLMEKIHKFKEEEKRGITDYLKEMTEEEREIENLFKSNKLERWSTGMQKGFRTYQGSTYDEERRVMEDQALLEKQLGKTNVITEQNKDIYMMEAIQEQATDTEINKEVYSLAGIGNDDDYAGDGDEYY